MSWERHAGVGELYASWREWLPDFVRAGNRLSGRSRMPAEAEIAAHRGLLMCGRLAPANFTVLLSYMEPAAALREADQAPFEQLLRLANAHVASADELASLFRLLRPFTDANRRCGRALWMWRAARGSTADRAALRAYGQASSRRKRRSRQDCR